MKTPCFVVVGYNNVRIYDVAKMRAEAQENFGAKMVLVVEKKTDSDSRFADLVVETSFDLPQLEHSLSLTCSQLVQEAFLPIGILPFSDRGVPLGALMANKYALPGAMPEQALAGLDKHIFRQLDSRVDSHPPGYRIVTSEIVNSLEELQNRVNKLGGKAFIKPAKEGNSRGCQVIEHVEDCEKIWLSMAPYHAAGVLVEALVENAREYSWDWVAGRQWITEKYTTEGHFCAEYQQIVPANLSSGDALLLHSAGEHMRCLVSPQNGAWHNEIFLMVGATAAVETNMRPAGMHIWDLAALSFDNFNPWLLWLRWAVDGTFAPEPLWPRYYSGIRMLRGRVSGRLRSLPDIQSLADRAGIELYQGTFSARIGDRVSEDIKTNADFMGHIVICAREHQQLVQSLAHLAAAIELATEIE